MKTGMRGSGVRETSRVRHLRSATGIVAAGAVVAGIAVTLTAVGRALPVRQAASVWDGVYTEAQAQRGAPLYEAACAECHGSDLTGFEMAPGLAGSEFVWNWNGLSVGDLFERVRVSMPQADPNGVSRQEKADILAYMLEANGFPAGETELANRTNQLRGVSFLAQAP